MRFAHILRDNKASDYPQQAVWFDTETRFETPNNETIYHILKFGYACSMRRQHGKTWTEEQWLRFETRAEFWDWVVSKCRKKTKLYLFCHNTNFDLPVMDVFKELPARGFQLKTAIIDGPPTILRYRKEGMCIMILDTLNIWRMPLAVLGRETGLEKLDMPEDNDLGVTWDTYGKRDVEIIRDACIKWWDFLEANDYGCFAPTLASQAMHAFRHKYMRHEIFIDTNEQSLKLTRDAYHGARCECFRIGKIKESLTLADVNSMYPHVMAIHEYPRRLLSHTRYANLKDLQNWLKQYCLTARVLLRTSEPFAAIKEDGKLIFPIGEFEADLQTPEIEYAMEHAEVVEVRQVSIYEKAYLFTEMMLDLYAKRLASKDANKRVDAFLYRKLLNSFYGKWGQNGFKWMEDHNVPELTFSRWMDYDAVTKKVVKFRQLGGLVQKLEDTYESRESFPAIAGHITAHARMYLWYIIRCAGRQNVYYCDTDSVLVNAEGRRNIEFLADPKLMGKLSIKGEYTLAEIWGAKDYRFGEVSRTKGVRKDAIWLDDFNVSQTKWSGLRGLVSAGVADKPITKTIKKHLARIYDKGTVLADGTVLPKVLPLMSA